MLSSYYKLYSVFNFLFSTTDIWICKTITHKTTFKNPVTFLTRADLYIQKHQVRHIKATLGVVLIPSIISSIGITTLGYIIKGFDSMDSFHKWRRFPLMEKLFPWYKSRIKGKHLHSWRDPQWNKIKLKVFVTAIEITWVACLNFWNALCKC